MQTQIEAVRIAATHYISVQLEGCRSLENVCAQIPASLIDDAYFRELHERNPEMFWMAAESKATLWSPGCADFLLTFAPVGDKHWV